MIVRHLGDTDFEVIMGCFLLSFENYFVQMPTDHEFYRERWKAAGVRFDLSYGMFDCGKLVGFIINAVDERQGERIAYNSGTGVIPDYRGKRIVKAIYDYAIPDLIENGITKCQLEVITENEKAIKSYEGIGFSTCKHYKCFKGVLSAKDKNSFTLKKVLYKDMNWKYFPNKELYSWDNQKESIEKGDFQYYQVLVEDKLLSFFIMNSESGYIAQFEVVEDTPSQWETLFYAIKSVNRDIRINNIDGRLLSKIRAVESVGLTNTVDQFEMELNITSIYK